MHWFLDPIQKHYADFDGRIGRQEFWMYALFVFGISVILNALRLDVISMVVSLGLLVPNLAMGSRRLHDTGRSGWWQLLMFIPIVGWIIIIVLLAQETTPVDNEYGKPAVPKVSDTPQAAATPPANDAAQASSNTTSPTPE